MYIIKQHVMSKKFLYHDINRRQDQVSYKILKQNLLWKKNLLRIEY